MPTVVYLVNTELATNTMAALARCSFCGVYVAPCRPGALGITDSVSKTLHNALS